MTDSVYEPLFLLMCVVALTAVAWRVLPLQRRGRWLLLGFSAIIALAALMVLVARSFR